MQPFDGPENPLQKASHLSFSFQYFMHGESCVCAAVDVRHHPAVRKLSQNHTHTAKALGPSSVPVILAPYGIAATLSGVSYRHNDDKDSGISKLLSDWNTFYPLDKNR